MKVETPQILWHNGADNDNGKNAPLYSVSMLESGFCQDSFTTYGHVLATSGNSSEINLWKLSFRNDDETSDSNGKTQHNDTPAAPMPPNAASNSSSKPRILQTQPHTRIEHMLSLTRHERSVNAIAFSPDGLHLATAGDAGSILVWSVPPSKRGNHNGKHFWSTLERERDLTFRLISSPSEGICDIAWSPDSKRFVVGSIDHCVQIYEDVSFDVNNGSIPSLTMTTVQPQKPQVESQWLLVHRNTRDHTHFVQGVAFDPLGVYVASMGSDRTVRVHARKPPSGKAKKKEIQRQLLYRPIVGNNGGGGAAPITVETGGGPLFPSPEHQARVERFLADSKFELGKAKTLKYREITSAAAATTTTTTDDPTRTAPPPLTSPSIVTRKKQHLFADESTVESFFRRLSWTADGAFLVTPAGLWHQEIDKENNESSSSLSSPSFACFLFARHKYDAPYKVLSGLEKPAVAVRPSPVLYELPDSVAASSTCPLPYRSIFAVLTQDSVLIYDTHHDRPLCIARGLHYAGLTDCTWSVDGRQLVVSSTDGYLSILSFAMNEFGKVYAPRKAEVSTAMEEEKVAAAKDEPPALRAPTMTSPRIPPCEPGQTASIEGRPAKRVKTRIAPTLVSAPSQAVNVPRSEETKEMVQGSETSQPVKAKKRIQPTLVSATGNLASA